MLVPVLFFAGCVDRLEGVLVEDTIGSQALDTRYYLGTYVHPDAELGPGAPWLLLLDGDIALERTAALLDREVARGRARPIVLVGLGRQSTRTRDYTTVPELPLDPDEEWDPRWGGGVEPFFAFVDDKVVPRVEEDLDIGGDPEARGVAGHSFGGLATLWALTHDRATFRRFGASSPSLWWDEGAAFDWPIPEDADATLYVSMGSTEVPPMNVLFDAYVERLALDPSVDTTPHVYQGLDHYSVIDHSLPDILSNLWPAEGR